MISSRAPLSQVLRAVVTDEVVARHYVVDLEALGAGEALADVTLEEALPVQAARPPAVVEKRTPGLAVAGLAGGRGEHFLLSLPQEGGFAA